MKRRNFLKTTSLSLLMNPFKFDTEYDILLKNIENTTRLDPHNGLVPFKPYNYQKKILRQIADHNKIIFLKARQIGITTLFKNSGISRNHASFWFMDSSFEKNVAEEINFIKNDIILGLSFKSLIKNSGDKKTIIAGSVDPYGNMKWAFKNAHKYGFKFFTYNIYDCLKDYDIEKIIAIYEKRWQPTWAIEYECKL